MDQSSAQVEASIDSRLIYRQQIDFKSRLRAAFGS
jgi:hypothetical protein